MIFNIAILGENQSGKTTLFNILNNSEQYGLTKSNITKIENNQQLRELFGTFDVIIYVLSYNSDIINYEQIKDINDKISINYEHYGKIVKFVVIFNKCDNDKNFGPNEQNLSNQENINKHINFIKNDIKNDINNSITFVQTSLLFTYMYAKIKNAIDCKKYDDISEDILDPIGIYLNGRAKWKKFTTSQRKLEITKYFKSISYDDIYTTEFSSSLNILTDFKLDEFAIGKVSYFACKTLTFNSVDNILEDYNKLYKFTKLRDTLANYLKNSIDKFLEAEYDEINEIMIERFDVINKLLINKKCFVNNIIQDKILIDYKDIISKKICINLLKEIEVLKQFNDFNKLIEIISLLSKFEYYDIENIIESSVLNNENLISIVNDDNKIMQCCELIKQTCDNNVVLSTAYQLLLAKYKQTENITHLYLAKEYFNNQSKRDLYPMFYKVIFVLDNIIHTKKHTSDDIDINYIKKSKQDIIFYNNIFAIENYIKKMQYNNYEKIDDSKDDDSDDKNLSDSDGSIEEETSSSKKSTKSNKNHL
jgi:hypothetical protein